MLDGLPFKRAFAFRILSFLPVKNVHFESFPSSFSPTSCFHFLQFLLSISNPLLCLRDKWRKTSLDPQNNQARGRLLFSLLAGDRDQGLRARGGRESLCTCSCTTAGSKDPRVSLSPSFPPHFPDRLDAAASHGKLATTGQQERRSIGWKTSCTQRSQLTASGSRASTAAGARWAWSLWTRTSKVLPCSWLWDPEGLLSCAVCVLTT